MSTAFGKMYLHDIINKQKKGLREVNAKKQDYAIQNSLNRC